MVKTQFYRNSEWRHCGFDVCRQDSPPAVVSILVVKIYERLTALNVACVNDLTRMRVVHLMKQAPPLHGLSRNQPASCSVKTPGAEHPK